MFWLFGVSLLSSVMKQLWRQEHSENRKRKKKKHPTLQIFSLFHKINWSPTARECVSHFPIKDRRNHTLFSAHGCKRKWQWLWSAFHVLFDNVFLDKIWKKKQANGETDKKLPYMSGGKFNPTIFSSTHLSPVARWGWQTKLRLV